MKPWNAGKLIAPLVLICAMSWRLSAAQAAPPLVLGYYTNWSTYGAMYQPSDIASGVDEILYAFAEVGDCGLQNPKLIPTEVNYTQPGSCHQQLNTATPPVEIHSGIQDYRLHSTDPWSDFCVYLNRDKVNIGGLCNIGNTLKTNKAVLLSIGGWTLSAAIRGAIQPANIDNFIASIIALMHQAEADAATKGITTNKFTGVDVDWEPNGNLWTLPSAGAEFVSVSTADLANYRTFLTQLKTALSKAGYSTLTIAMTANPAAIADVNTKSPGYWSSLATAGVRLNLMTYDYNGQLFPAGCTVTEFNSPLNADPNNPCASVKNFDTNDSVAALKATGVPKGSIGIGIPAYGRAYAVGDFSKLMPNNPYIPFIAPLDTVKNVAVPQYDLVWTYREIMTGRAYGGDCSTDEKCTTTEKTTWTPIGQYVASGGAPVQSFGKAYVNYTAPAFISYSGYSDAQTVMTYAVTNGLASVMVWELDQDVQAGDVGYDGKTPLDVSTTSIISGLASKKP